MVVNNSTIHINHCKPLLDNLSEGVILIDSVGKIVFINKTLATMIDLSIDNWINKSIKEFGIQSMSCQPVDFMELVRSNFVPQKILIKQNKGAGFSTNCNVKKMVLANREYYLILLTSVSDPDLDAHELKYKILFRHSQSVMLIIDDKTGQIIESNHAAASFFDYSIEELNRKKIQEINISTDKEIEIAMKKIRQNKASYFEFRHRLKTGKIRDVALHSGKISIGNADYLLIIIHDITEKKIIEEQLKKREQDLKIAQRIAHLGSWKFNIKDQTLEVSNEMRKIFHYPYEKKRIPVEEFLTYVHKDYRGPVRQKLDLLTKGANEIYDEFIIVRPDQTERILKTQGKQYFDEFYKKKIVFGTALDITDIRRTERELKSQSQLVQQSPVAIIRTDKDLKIKYINASTEKLYGCRLVNIYDQTPDIFLIDKDPKFYKQVENLNSSQKITMVHRGKDNKKITVDLTVSPIWNDHHSITGYMFFIQDITNQKQIEAEKKNLENHIQQAQRLETIGTMAGGIAHEFNNLLTPILGHAEMIQMESHGNRFINSSAAEIFKAGNRAKELIAQMLSFSRSQTESKTKIFIHPIIKEAIKFVKSSLPSSVKIHTNIDDNCHKILGNGARIHQVIINLLTNAIQAMDKKGGILSVSLSNVTLSGKNEDCTNLQPGNYVKISVKDTGIGMTKKTVEKMFDPFFTTKCVRKGTGLGLSVVHGIIKDHSGDIFVSSKIDQGTRVSVYLPALIHNNKTIESINSKETNDQLRKVLLIDDELSIRKTMEKYFPKLQCNLLSFERAEDALNYFKSNHPSDLIITDLSMPGMNGIEFVKQIRKYNNRIPVIMMAGDNDNLRKEDIVSLKIYKILQKPILLDKLSRVLRDIFKKE